MACSVYEIFPCCELCGAEGEGDTALTDLTTMAMASLTVENQVVGRKTILEPKTAAIWWTTTVMGKSTAMIPIAVILGCAQILRVVLQIRDACANN